MSDDEQRREMAAGVQGEAKRFGRNLSPQRALEIAKEVQRYEDAIRQLAPTEAMDQEPSDFLHVLIRLGKTSPTR